MRRQGRRKRRRSRRRIKRKKRRRRRWDWVWCINDSSQERLGEIESLQQKMGFDSTAQWARVSTVTHVLIFSTFPLTPHQSPHSHSHAHTHSQKERTVDNETRASRKTTSSHHCLLAEFEIGRSRANGASDRSFCTVSAQSSSTNCTTFNDGHMTAMYIHDYKRRSPPLTR